MIGVKRLIAVLLIVIFATMLLPLAIVWLVGRTNEQPDLSSASAEISVYNTDTGRVEEMNANDYLKCVVAAEMPADFEEEALKAQAVAARTYLYAHIEAMNNGNIFEAHNGAPVCTDSTHCQAYITKEKRFESWGGEAEANWDKISRAVDETDGEIMTFGGEIISAVFHSTSSGATEAAVDVWGTDVSYLQSVKSEGDEQSPKFYSSLTVSEDEFKSTVDEKVTGTDWDKGLFTDIERSAAGGIISLKLGGITVKGTELRAMFNLRSTNIELTQENGSVRMDVRGYGHGVGMSQYGANYMAEQGKNYEEILKTYYTGVEIEKHTIW